MLLSICIPTYNRPARMARALERYEKVIAGNSLQGKVELCISDNTPTNETRTLVEKFSKASKLVIRYRQNKENLGYDSNTMLALGMARGKYAHLVSDEDLYSERRLLELLGILENEQSDCIILSGHLPTRLKISGTTARWNGMGEREILRRMLSLSGKGTIFLGLISCMIIKSDVFAAYSKKIGGAPGIFLGTGYAPVPAYLYALSQAKNAVVSSELFRDKEDVSNTAAPLTIALPHELFRLMHVKYFGAMKLAREAGIITADEHKLFLDRFFRFSIYNILEIRLFMCPEILRADKAETVKYASVLADDYSLSGAARALFSAYVWLVYLPLPYHWIYAAWAWYRISVKKHKDVIDIHRAYRGMLSTKGQKFDTFAERDPTWKK